MKLRSAVGLCKTMCVGKMIRVHRSVAPDVAKACAFSMALTSLCTITGRTAS